MNATDMIIRVLQHVKPVLLQGIVRDEPAFSNFQTHPRLSSCAVVSNSGALLSQSLGYAIDHADAVFRVNTAPTAGYETQVGGKTNFRFGYTEFIDWLLDHPAEVLPDVTYVFLLFRKYAPVEAPQLKLLQDKHPGYTFYYIVEDTIEALNSAMLQLYPLGWVSPNNVSTRTDWDLQEGKGGVRWLTTGGVAMLSALSICDNVSAFEMIPSAYATGAPYHYYDQTNSNWHPSFQEEHDLWRRLSSTSEDDIYATGVATFAGLS